MYDAYLSIIYGLFCNLFTFLRSSLIFWLIFKLLVVMGVARGKSGWGSFPKGRRPRAGCWAEPHVEPQAKFFWVLYGGRIPKI